MAAEAIRWHSTYGHRAGLLTKVGRRHLHVVLITEGGVRLVKLPLDERERMKPLERNGKPYPAARAARELRRAGKRWGISQEARSALREVAAANS